jgi:uncharacterized membrane protein YphA (DoxX/SURF4 family)
MKKTQIPASILIILWIYTGLEKLLDFRANRNAFHNQVFPSEIADYLAYAVPSIELVLGILLIFTITRWWGFIGSLLLLSIFSTYVGLIWIEAFPRVPCNCAGILEQIGWAEHLVLNLALIVISGWGLAFSSPVAKKK